MIYLFLFIHDLGSFIPPYIPTLLNIHVFTFRENTSSHLYNIQHSSNYNVEVLSKMILLSDVVVQSLHLCSAFAESLNY